MGTSQNKLTIVTLNYSGIYLSPFEYYGIDNWQELQKIGRIFEKNLKEQYKALMTTMELRFNIKLKKNTYSRDSFKWDIGDIDKDIHQHRYSPLYCSEQNINKMMFAGIQQREKIFTLQTKDEFLSSWENKFVLLKNSNEKEDQVIIKAAKKATEAQAFQCSLLDFLCYQAILQYLYKDDLNSGQYPIKSNNSQIPFDKMIEAANSKAKQKDHDRTLLRLYRKFMVEYFDRIDIKRKINLTIDNLFKKHKLDIICLIQATPDLRNELKKRNQFYMFGPKEEKAVKQCILMVRKDLKFISKYYQPEKKDDVTRLKKELDIIFSKPDLSLSKIKSQIELHSRKHIKETYRTQLKDIMDRYGNDLPRAKQQIEKTLDKYSENPFKAKVQDEISQYMQAFKQYCQSKSNFSRMADKDKNSTLQFLNDLKTKGMLFWATDVTFARFENQADKIIIASFHLSSRLDRNRIEVLIIGIIIRYLEKHKYKYIFGGDFNSYITVEDESIEFGLFDFIKEQDHEGVEEIIRNIHIFPRHPKMITTKKKRTILQPQIRKVNELVEKCIDQILTNLPIIYSESHIGQIDEINQQKRTTQSFLPHMKHPYDHLLVQTKIDSSSLGKAPDCR